MRIGQEVQALSRSAGLTAAGVRHAELIARLEAWLAMRALEDTPVTEMIEPLCRRLRQGGVPVSRLTLGWRLLHPLYRAEDHTWDLRGKPERRRFGHDEEQGERFLNSPLAYAVGNDVETLRRRLDTPQAVAEYPLFGELAAAGHTDYLLMLVPFGPREKALDWRRGMFISVCSDANEGFGDEDMGLLERLRYMLAIASRSTISSEIATAIATTYLGPTAAKKVLDGSIRRGDGEMIRAVIWYCDLRGSTALAERLEPQAYLDVLNGYFEATAGPVTAAGGEVLDFIGDAVLAVFPRFEEGISHALAATDEALARLDALRRSVPALDRRESIAAGIAISAGEVMFGNIGIPDRLTFSVIGPTVNEVSRIEQLTKLLEEPVLVTAEIAAANPNRWSSRGTFVLAGKSEPLEVFGLAASRRWSASPRP